MMDSASTNGGVAIVSGARTPLARAGGALRDVHVTDLAKVAMLETLLRANWPADRVDEVILGNVVMPVDAANPARVAALWAGLPERIPAVTVQRNCASGMESIAEAAERIQTGRARAVVAGGAESMSGIPLLFPQETSAVMLGFKRARSVWERARALGHVRLRHIRPVIGLELGLTDPTCGMNMGGTAEVLAHAFDISREAQDALALQSHQRASAAMRSGYFEAEIAAVYSPPRFEPVTQDTGVRENQSLDALERLRPVFDRRDGTVTVGNSCQVTDGAAAVLVMGGEMARAEGLDVLGYVRDYARVGLDPERMGLGPVFAIDRLLRRAKLTLNDIDLLEINEAFAAQVLACLKAMGSRQFAREHLDRHEPLGEVDPARLNVNGGAIALGHPVGASGTRLVLTLLHELRRRDARLGIAALCVGGGQGMAMLVEAEKSKSQKAEKSKCA